MPLYVVFVKVKQIKILDYYFGAFAYCIWYNINGDYMENRIVDGIEYVLTRKRVKNINIRITSNGTVAVSAPKFVPLSEIDLIILKRREWIINAKAAKEQRQNEASEPLLYTKEECLKEFYDIAEKIFPLFTHILDNKMPIIKVRNMKTRWGVCHIQKRVIVLNMRLMEKPYAAREYVIMHEFMHFLHPDHQKGFHSALLAVMPDYKQRRLLLK